MASTAVKQNDYAVIPQGSNNPLVIEFDEPMTMPVLSVSLWDNTQTKGIKKWSLDDVTVQDNLVICPLTEEETRNFPSCGVVLEVKAVDDNGYTVFWQHTPVKVAKRSDRFIDIVGDDGQ